MPSHTARALAAGGVARTRSVLLWLLLVLLLAAAVAAHVGAAQPLRIVTSSMAPTLVPGEHVLATTLGRADGAWRRGDLVVVHDHRVLLVKRVVGVAHDRVALRDGRLWRNGRQVREPWSDPRRIDGVYYGPVSVPAGHVLVMGDNRRESRDSRVFGPVPVTELRGRVVSVLWPPRRWGGVS
ncbi:MAG TPA: signal peptidase I [Nocardioidaceae bacterium]|nr:signal peptidase I [Nocardioidaceae bacterium]